MLSSMDTGSVFIALLSTVFLLYVFGKLKSLYGVFREYYVLWNVYVGAQESRRNISIKKRLHAYECKTALLDVASINQIYMFVTRMTNSELSLSQFHKDLLSYSFVVLFREQIDGSLRGLMRMGIDNRDKGGKRYTLIRIGLTLLEKKYQGGPTFRYIVTYHVLHQLLLHPFTPVYITSKLFSKSYLVLINNFKNVYPRCDAETPPFEQKLIDDFALSVKSPNEFYDPSRCVLERTRMALKEFVAPILDKDLHNPHIKFFQETNPGWSQGHQLISIGYLTWTDFVTLFLKTISRVRSSRKE